MACRDLVEAIEIQIGMPKGSGGTIWSRVNRIRDCLLYTSSKEQILEAVFGFDNESNDSTIITHIKNIRAKFADYDYTPVSYTHLPIAPSAIFSTTSNSLSNVIVRMS